MMTPCGHADRLEGHPLLHLAGASGGQREEDRGDPGGIHDDKKGEEEGAEDGDVEHQCGSLAGKGVGRDAWR